MSEFDNPIGGAEAAESSSSFDEAAELPGSVEVGDAADPFGDYRRISLKGLIKSIEFEAEQPNFAGWLLDQWGDIRIYEFRPPENRWDNYAWFICLSEADGKVLMSYEFEAPYERCPNKYLIEATMPQILEYLEKNVRRAE